MISCIMRPDCIYQTLIYVQWKCSTNTWMGLPLIDVLDAYMICDSDKFDVLSSLCKLQTYSDFYFYFFTRRVTKIRSKITKRD